jgi:hypothetical protein
MRSLNSFLLACCLIVAGCASVPTLEETTDSTNPPVFIKDVVRRIKCELNFAADYLKRSKNTDKLGWTKDWQAKVNLSLQVANTAGLTPNVQTVRFLHSAFYNAKTATGADLLAAVQQKFTFGTSITVSGSATRIELIVFTVPFGDIILKGPAYENCEEHGRALLGNLGLQEWVVSAFDPVAQGQLFAGKKPKGSIDQQTTVVKALEKWTKDKADQANLARLIASEDPRVRVISYLAEFQRWTSQMLGSAEARAKLFWPAVRRFSDACLYEAMIELFSLPREGNLAREIIFSAPSTVCDRPHELARKIDVIQKWALSKKDVLKSVDQALDHYDAKIGHFRSVMRNDALKAELSKYKDYLDALKKLFGGDGEFLNTTRVRTLRAPNEFCHFFGGNETERCGAKPDKGLVYFELIWQAGIALFAEATAETSAEVAKYVQSFTPSRPIDSVTHTVTFVVTYGAGIQPNWTLINVAGPLTPLATAQGARTHSVIIALGPEEENKTNIQNQTVQQSRQ